MMTRVDERGFEMKTRDNLNFFRLLTVPRFPFYTSSLGTTEWVGFNWHSSVSCPFASFSAQFPICEPWEESFVIDVQFSARYHVLDLF